MQGYLLMVEDEPQVQANNKRILERRGYKIKQAFNLAQARELTAEQMPAAIVLDVNLPDGLGTDFLQEFRKVSNVPVLILTSKGAPADIVQGLEAGADDYLVKPYDLDIFLARIAALMRRASIMPESLNIGNISINIATSKAYVNGEDLGLSQKEMSLLQHFVQYPEEIVPAKVLYEKVWGHEMGTAENAVKVAISKLRAKLVGSGYTISASRGEGYYFEME
ncbi:MAG: response regulator transcription factor [Defluviitaleaceae bacterium]|nr:response regulator transcription factor [Defluviitaleaceae bacterium]